MQLTIWSPARYGNNNPYVVRFAKNSSRSKNGGKENKWMTKTDEADCVG